MNSDILLASHTVFRILYSREVCDFGRTPCFHHMIKKGVGGTHPKQWAAIYAAAPGEQLGVRCLAQGHLSHGIEGGESTVHSLPPITIPARPETRTHNLWVMSPTL